MTNTLSSCYRLCDVGGFPFASSPRLCFSLFLLLIGNPISNKNKNDELGEEAKGKPPTTQNTQSHSSCKVHLGGLLELVKIAQRRYNSFSIFRPGVQYILLRRVCKPPSPIES